MNKKYTKKLKLNDSVCCTTEMLFVPSNTVNDTYDSTFEFDTLQLGSKFNREIINAKELYEWLKQHYEPLPNDGRSYVCASMLY